MYPIETLLIPHDKDLGAVTVSRILPQAKKRTVGPFIFLDHIGPTTFSPGTGIDVRPHPHIGLATVTYLLSGSLLHRDNLGSIKHITPGDVNWMTAGKGIVHSERTPDEVRSFSHNIHGLQCWVALPEDQEEIDPEFFHHPSSTLPKIHFEGIQATLVAGSAYNKVSPVKIYSPLFFLDVEMQAGSKLDLPEEYTERAIYPLSGQVYANEALVNSKTLPILAANVPVTIKAITDTRLIILGGQPLTEEKHIWWNFVSSSKERIEQAKLAWQRQEYKKIPGEIEFIPLPE